MPSINRNLSPVRSSGQHPPIGQSHRQIMSYVLQTRLSTGRLRRLLELYDIRVLSRPDNVLTQIRDFIGGRICETDWKGNVLENAVFEIVHTSLRAYLRRLGVLEISYEKNTTGGIGLMIKAFYDVGEPRPKLPSWLKRDWLVLREGRCSNYSSESANSRIQPGHQTYNTTSSEYVGTVGPIMQAVMRNGSINKYFLTAGHTLNDFAGGLIIRQPHSLTGEAVASVLNSFRRIGRRPVWRLAETEGMLDDVCICKISESDSELFHGIITCIDCHKFSFEDNTDSVMRSPISNPRVRGLLQQILVSGSIGVFKAGAMTSVESATRRGVTDRNKNRSTLVNDMSEANDPLNNPNPSTSYSGVQNPQRVEVTVCTLAVMAVVDFAYFLCQAQITLPPVSSWHCT